MEKLNNRITWMKEAQEDMENKAKRSRNNLSRRDAKVQAKFWEENVAYLEELKIYREKDA